MIVVGNDCDLYGIFVFQGASCLIDSSSDYSSGVDIRTGMSQERRRQHVVSA